jgi:hypothetical protein
MLKVFAGADPQLVFAGRADWHRAKQTELEGYLRMLRSNPDPARPAGPEATLIGGIAYHDQMAATFDRLLDPTRGNDT